MNIVCVICSDLLEPSDDVFHTPCGHIFHYACLIQWLERSKTCPQCRERTTSLKIQRIYFNFSNNDSIVEDTTSLQNKIDNLIFQLKLRDENLNNLTENNEKLKKQTAGLRQQVQKVESEINGKNSAIHALQEQIKFYKQQCSDANNYKKENEDLKKNLEHLKNVQNLIDHSMSEVNDIIMNTSDASKLITYIAVLRRELMDLSEKSKEIRERYKNLLQKYSCVSKENKLLSQEYTKRKELEEQLMICESKKISLQAQLLDVQTDTHKCICNKVSAEKQESLKVYKENNITEESNVEISGNATLEDFKSLTIKFEKNKSCIVIDPDSTENTPQSIKSQGFFSMRDNCMKRQKSSNSLKVPSILVKKSRLNQPSQKTASGSGMSFDGFGGHAKYDKFPNPIPNLHIKKTREDSKMRKLKLDTGDNKKISDVLMYNNIII